MLSDLTLEVIVLRVVAGVIIATVHGFAIAGAAVLLGDQGPRYDGRLSLLPSRHVDLVGLASLILTSFGWSRPVAVEAAKLRIGRWGLVVVVLSGAAALLVLGFLLLLLVIPLLTALDYTSGVVAAAFLRGAAGLCIWSALLSLVPIPPLAGAHFLDALGIRVPKQAGTYLGWALLIVSVFGVTRLVLTPAYALVAPFALGSAAASVN